MATHRYAVSQRRAPSYFELNHQLGPSPAELQLTRMLLILPADLDKLLIPNMLPRLLIIRRRSRLVRIGYLTSAQPHPIPRSLTFICGSLK